MPVTPRPTTTAQLIARERSNLERRVRDLTGHRHSVLTKAMRGYFNLSPQLTVGCRIIEAYKLLQLARADGNTDEIDLTTSLLRQAGTDTHLECQCNNTDCDQWHVDDPDNDESDGYCECLESGHFCNDVRVYVETGSGRAIYGDSRQDRRQEN